MSETKRCSKCKQAKPIDRFCRNKSRKDGMAHQCKECVSVRNREYKAKNLDKQRVYEREWRVRNRDILLARQHKYNAANRDRKNAYSREWHARNRDRILARKCEWRAKNQDRIKIADAEYRAKNPDKLRAKMSRRRAREQNAAGDATAEQIAARWEVYGATCYICGSEAEAIDHVIPLAAGGSNWPANLRPICKRCNSVKGAIWPCDFVKVGPLFAKVGLMPCVR